MSVQLLHVVSDKDNPEEVWAICSWDTGAYTLAEDRCNSGLVRKAYLPLECSLVAGILTVKIDLRNPLTVDEAFGFEPPTKEPA